MVRTQFGVQVKLFRSDNGGEFFNFQCNELFKNHGIVHQCSCSHTPQQNGLVERKHRHILESARAIIFQDHLPIRFWREFILVVVHIINRVPLLSILNNGSAFEIMSREPPDISYMRVMGCLRHVTITHKNDKFGPRATRSVLVGYGDT